MLSDVIDKRIQDISTIADELEHLVPRDGWTDYALGLLARLQMLAIILDDEDERADDMFDAFKNAWITTENKHKIHIGDDGEPDMGNPHVLAAIEGAIKNKESQFRKEGMKCENSVKFENAGAITTDKIGRKVTHFNHDENKMKVTRRMRVKDDKGNTYSVDIGEIDHLTVFASEELDNKVKVADKLSMQVGGDKSKWKHVKGMGMVTTPKGEKKEADLHWFENPESGQVGWKIKQFREDMDESEVYW